MDLSHEIDYIQWLFGEIKHISAINDKISNLEIESDDYVALVGKTKKGAYLTLCMDYLSKIPVREIIIQTENATIKADLVAGSVVRKQIGEELEAASFPELDRNSTYSSMHKALFSKDFGDICTYREGIEVMNTVEKIRSSAKEQNINAIV